MTILFCKLIMKIIFFPKEILVYFPIFFWLSQNSILLTNLPKLNFLGRAKTRQKISGKVNTY